MISMFSQFLFFLFLFIFSFLFSPRLSFSTHISSFFFQSKTNNHNNLLIKIDFITFNWQLKTKKGKKKQNDEFHKISINFPLRNGRIFRVGSFREWFRRIAEFFFSFFDFSIDINSTRISRNFKLIISCRCQCFILCAYLQTKRIFYMEVLIWENRKKKKRRKREKKKGICTIAT